MHVSAFTPHQCSFVHIQVRDRSVFIHMRVLSPDACGTFALLDLQDREEFSRNDLERAVQVA